MPLIISTRSRALRHSPLFKAIQRGASLAAALLGVGVICLSGGSTAVAQAPASHTSQKPIHHHHHKSASHRAAKLSPPPPAPVPPPPPPPDWPANESPSRAAVTWDSHGLRIEASNSSLQQILNDVSVQTGTKIEGLGTDQRVYGSYGPGQAREVISQLLQGSDYNVLLAGDLGSGAPRQVTLSPRKAAAGPSGAVGRMQPGTNSDDDADNDVEEPPPPPQQPIPTQPMNPAAVRPGFSPNGPIRTPQQVIEEMQRQQLLQQQQQGNQPSNSQQ